MKKITKFMDEEIIKVKCFAYNFFHDDNGDTNFISIAIVAAIVVVLAGFFMFIGKDTMKELKNQVHDFITNPKDSEPT